MKKILTVVLCICVALTLTVSAMAVSSPENKVIVREGTATQEDGTTIPEDTFAAVSDDHSITVTANEKVYGKFNNWTIFVVKQTGSTGAVEYTAAKEGVDYTIVSGSLTDGTLVIKPISQIAVCGNYASKTTDPAKASTENCAFLVRKGDATREDGTEIARDVFCDVPLNSVITVVADEKTFGKFNSWSVYVIDEVVGTSKATAGGISAASVINLAVSQKSSKAKAGVDYTVISGNLKSKTMKIKLLTNKKIAVCGNYAGTVTDPLLASSEKSPKLGDLNVMYVAVIMLAAGAVLLGAKRQLSK